MVSFIHHNVLFPPFPLCFPNWMYLFDLLAWARGSKLRFMECVSGFTVTRGYICGQGAELVMCIICIGLWSTAALCGRAEWIIWCVLMHCGFWCALLILNAENPSALLFILGISGSNYRLEELTFVAVWQQIPEKRCWFYPVPPE